MKLLPCSLTSIGFRSPIAMAYGMSLSCSIPATWADRGLSTMMSIVLTSSFQMLITATNMLRFSMGTKNGLIWCSVEFLPPAVSRVLTKYLWLPSVNLISHTWVVLEVGATLIVWVFCTIFLFIYSFKALKILWWLFCQELLLLLTLTWLIFEKYL